MAVLVEHSIRSAVELDDAVELADLPNFVQSPTLSQSKKIQEQLKKRQELREKFKEIFNEVADDQLGVVHRAIQVGESQIRKKPNTSSLSNGIHDILGQNKSQTQKQQGESVRYRRLSPDNRETSSRRSVHQINISDADKLYDDTQEDPTLNWVVPTNLYKEGADGTSRIIGSGYVNRKSLFARLQILLANLWIIIKRYSSRGINRIPLLRTQIRQIEGNFGVGIASFFVFARLVIVLNIILAVLWTCFVILPGAIKYNYSAAKGVFHVRNLFDGRGSIAESWLFYGGYETKYFRNCPNSTNDAYAISDANNTNNISNTSNMADVISSANDSNITINTDNNSTEDSSEGYYCDSYSYRIDIAYMVMIFVSLFGPFFVLSWSYSESLGSTGVSSSENVLAPFSVIVLTSWDHSLISSEAAINLSKGINNTLKDKLTEYRNAEKKKTQTKKEKTKILLRRLIAWLIAALLVAAAIFGIILSIVLGPQIRKAAEKSSNPTAQTIGEYLELYGTSVLFVVINALVPTFMFFLLAIEKYDSGKTEFNVTIMRVFLVRILNLYALMAGWRIAVDTCNLEESVCPGIYYGQELYKVTLLSCAATIFGQLILRFGYFYWFDKKKEFLIADAVLAVVYIQSVVWAGTPVCPFLPLIGAIGLLCLFFAYYYIVRYTCHPPIKRWSQSRTNSFFLFSLLAALVCVIIPVSITVQTKDVPLGFDKCSSVNDTKVFCGPFHAENAIRAVLPDDNCKDVPCILFYVLYSSAIGLPLIFCLVVALFQCSLRLNHARKKYAALLRELEVERQNMRKAKKAYHRLEFDLQQIQGKQQSTTTLVS